MAQPMVIRQLTPQVRHRLWMAFFCLMLAAHLAPIWYFDFFPSQDGPSHMYNAKLLLELRDPSNYQVRQAFRLNQGLHPNYLTQGLMAALQTVLAPRVAEKIVLSLAVGLLPVALAYLIGAARPGGRAFALVGFVFSHHNLLHMGFYNFSVSVSLAFFAIGYWWRRKDALRWRHLLALNALLLIVYSAHYVAFVTVLIAMGAITGLGCARTAAQGLRAPRKWKGALRASLEHLGAFAAQMLPAFLVAAEYYWRSLLPDKDDYHRLADLQTVFFKTLMLVSYTGGHDLVAKTLLWTLAAGLALTLACRLARRQWFLEKDGLLLLCAILGWLYFTLPWWKNDGGWVNDRLALFLYLFLACWFVPFHRWLNLLFALALGGLSLYQLKLLSSDYRRLQPEIREWAEAARHVAPHSTLGTDVDNGSYSAALGKDADHVGPFVHTGAYCAMARDVAYYNNYEPGCAYFAVQWNDGHRHEPDYVAGWSRPGNSARLDRYLKDHEEVFAGQRLRLFRRKPPAPDLAAWHKLPDERMALSLRMLARSADAAPEFREVHRRTRFEPGKYGWLSAGPAREWRGDPKLAEPARDLVGDRRERTFRLALPDGRYRVTLHFAPHRDGAYAVNVIANDVRALREFVVPEGESRRAAYRVDVHGGRLDQTFFTSWRASMNKRRLPFWGLSAIVVEQDLKPKPPEPPSPPPASTSVTNAEAQAQIAEPAPEPPTPPTPPAISTNQPPAATNAPPATAP